MDTFQHKSFLNEFQKIVKKYPESIAISTESEKISYQELDLRVTQVSYQLHGDGIRDGDVVALWMNKSPEYIVFILAIWKLNAVFLPIDAKTPELRVDWICENADVKLLVTDSQVFNNSGLVQLRSPTEQKLYSLNLLTLVRHIPQVRSEISDQGKFYSSMNVAYIIYTSGSTGNPKGVVGSHEGIVNFLEKQIEVFRVSPKSKILQYLSIGFDASLSEIGIALLSGSEIRIEEDSKLKSIDRLIEILEKERITHICLPPALLPLFPIQKIPSTLETVIIGGEVCPVETVRKWANKVRLVNVYGPTEATVCSSLIVCGSNWDKPLIGSPITGREFHILDETLSEVKIGESGELYLSGVGLALEYLGLPKLTKEKFLLLNGIRMYKTGDLVLKHSSEKIEFLGRVDRQFKHRGNLVEPFEVEQALTAMKGISFALVKKEKLHREVLVAYIQYSKSEPEEKQRAISILEIKSSLKKHYPSWMVPQKFIVLEKIPLNLNEKLDITSLPKLENSRPSYLSSYREPTTELEQ